MTAPQGNYAVSGRAPTRPGTKSVLLGEVIPQGGWRDQGCFRGFKNGLCEFRVMYQKQRGNCDPAFESHSLKVLSLAAGLVSFWKACQYKMDL